MSAFVDLTGQRFGRLIVLERALQSPGARVKWLCVCDCGEKKTVQRSDLRSGRTHSCGCLRLMVTSAVHTTHGMSQTSRFYRIWAEVIRRCTNPKCKSYEDYGGRGITVVERWRTFEHFRDDMYVSYLEHADTYGEKVTTIERLDINSGYCPGNTCWIQKSAQAFNTRSTINALGVKERSDGEWEAVIKRGKKRFSSTFPTREQALEWRNSIKLEYAPHNMQQLPASDCA